MLSGILSFRGGAFLDPVWLLAIFAFIMGVQLYQETRGEIRPHVDRVLQRSPYLAGAFLYTAVALALVVFYRGAESFIYFQF